MNQFTVCFSGLCWGVGGRVEAGADACVQELPVSLAMDPCVSVQGREAVGAGGGEGEHLFSQGKMKQ